MEGREDPLVQPMGEANEVFGRLAEVVEGAAKEGRPISVLDTAKKAGLEIDEGVLERLRLPLHIHPLPWLPWHHWYPWHPLWCWWWHRRYPWFHCHPWWWPHHHHWPR